MQMLQFNPRAVLVVDEFVLGQVLLRTLQFRPVSIVPQMTIFSPLSTVG
jgi:hypothetical protein